MNWLIIIIISQRIESRKWSKILQMQAKWRLKTVVIRNKSLNCIPLQLLNRIQMLGENGQMKKIISFACLWHTIKIYFESRKIVSAQESLKNFQILLGLGRQDNAEAIIRRWWTDLRHQLEPVLIIKDCWEIKNLHKD